MTPEERHILDQTRKLVEENNAILRKILRRGRIAAAFKVFYWLVIIAISVGAFYFVQPYIDDLLEVYGTAKENIQQIQSVLPR